MPVRQLEPCGDNQGRSNEQNLYQCIQCTAFRRTLGYPGFDPSLAVFMEAASDTAGAQAFPACPEQFAPVTSMGCSGSKLSVPLRSLRRSRTTSWPTCSCPGLLQQPTAPQPMLCALILEIPMRKMILMAIAGYLWKKYKAHNSSARANAPGATDSAPVAAEAAPTARP